MKSSSCHKKTFVIEKLLLLIHSDFNAVIELLPDEDDIFILASTKYELILPKQQNFYISFGYNGGPFVTLVDGDGDVNGNFQFLFGMSGITCTPFINKNIQIY